MTHDLLLTLARIAERPRTTSVSAPTLSAIPDT